MCNLIVCVFLFSVLAADSLRMLQHSPGNNNNTVNNGHEKFTVETAVNLKYSFFNEKPARIAILSQCGGEFYKCDDEHFSKAFWNHQDYAKKHGYEYFLLDKRISHRFMPWDRYPHIASVFARGAEWVLVLEADALVMNKSITVENFIAEHASEKDLIASGAGNEHYLGGNFLIRNSKWSKTAIRSAWDVCPSPGFDQMGGMMVVLGGGNVADPETWRSAYDKLWGPGVTANSQRSALSRLPEATRDHLALLPQQAMNGNVCSHWKHCNFQKGDWIVHFPGSKKHKKRQVDRYAPQANFKTNEDCNSEIFLDKNNFDDK